MQNETAMIVPGFPDKAIVCAPGRLGPGGAAGVMIFDVGQTMFTGDPVAQFFVEDADGLEWLRDFLCDTTVADTLAYMEALEDEEEKEEVELIFNRGDMSQGSSTPMDDTMI